jgi:hypothetical protein
MTLMKCNSKWQYWPYSFYLKKNESIAVYHGTCMESNGRFPICFHPPNTNKQRRHILMSSDAFVFRLRVVFPFVVKSNPTCLSWFVSRGLMTNLFVADTRVHTTFKLFLHPDNTLKFNQNLLFLSPHNPLLITIY